MRDNWLQSVENNHSILRSQVSEEAPEGTKGQDSLLPGLGYNFPNWSPNFPNLDRWLLQLNYHSPLPWFTATIPQHRSHCLRVRTWGWLGWAFQPEVSHGTAVL